MSETATIIILILCIIITIGMIAIEIWILHVEHSPNKADEKDNNLCEEVTTSKKMIIE